MEIADLQRSSYKVSREHGFWDDADTLQGLGYKPFVFRYVIPTKLALMASELTEALDNVRDGSLEAGDTLWVTADGKPEGFASELADAVIRIMDTAEYLGIDLSQVIEAKEAYNRTRPSKHGKTI